MNQVAKTSQSPAFPAISRAVGPIPYRLALAGGWIDQPFVSKLNPNPPGSMVVVCVEPEFRFMERSGMASGTRDVAARLWNNRVPNRDTAALVRELFAAENNGKADPSGSQDMIGLLYPGVNRLDYDYHVNYGVFPIHIESNNDLHIARWLQDVMHILPVAPRPEGYSPLGRRNLDAEWIGRLGQTGRACYEAIVSRDIVGLGTAMNDCMKCWETLLPDTVRHPALKLDLIALLRAYQETYPGAMYSGCGGGYLFVVSEAPVPGAFKVTIKLKPSHS